LEGEAAARAALFGEFFSSHLMPFQGQRNGREGLTKLASGSLLPVQLPAFLRPRSRGLQEAND
jgi:hypothetical protein